MGPTSTVHHNAPNVCQAWEVGDRHFDHAVWSVSPTLAGQRGATRVSQASFHHELNGQFKGIFDGHGQVPTKGLTNAQQCILGVIFVCQLTLLCRFEHQMNLRVGAGWKAFLKAA